VQGGYIFIYLIKGIYPLKKESELFKKYAKNMKMTEERQYKEKKGIFSKIKESWKNAGPDGQGLSLFFASLIGLGTLYLGFGLYEKNLREERLERQKSHVERMLDKYDSNKDNVLDREELRIYLNLEKD
jgi:hypothetical protein